MSKKVFNRFLHYTETIFLWLTVCYFIWEFISLAMIFVAIKETMTFSYLDTFVMETNQTFRDIAGVVIIKFLVENVFKYNKFKGIEKPENDEEVTEVTEPTEGEPVYEQTGMDSQADQ